MSLDALDPEAQALVALALDPAMRHDRLAAIADASAGEQEARRRGIDVAAALDRLARRGAHAFVRDRPGYPIGLPLPDRPVVLLAEGSRPDVLRRPRVAVIGTRAATPHGIADAREIGAFLASQGVTVVSGLAIGIDGAAHDGACAAGGGAVGVVATGLDVEYPRRHRALYARVREQGLVLGETAYGVRPARWRFPVRNRIIAALADLIVVVEATRTGGSFITADAALDQGRDVMVLPGSRRNPAARGCNELLTEGARPLVEPSDILEVLEMSGAGAGGWRERQRVEVSVDAARVAHAFGGEPATLDDLVDRTRLPLPTVAAAVRELSTAGRLMRHAGLLWPR